MCSYTDGMANVEETAAVIALVRRGDRLWHHYADLVDSTGSALAILTGDYEEPGAPQSETLFTDAREDSSGVDALPGIVEEVEAWRAEGMEIVTVLDDEYPANLRTIHNRPPFLFVAGRLTHSDENSIAVVGTRRSSAEGLRIAGEMASEIAERGYTVVSGLAEGIDTAAHLGALSQGGRTVAVIGTGLRRTYPQSNASLQRRLAEESAVLSQFWPDAPPTRSSFPMRNIVMSGLALATVVVEASDTSGARMQARYALEHGRPVFLFAALLQHAWGREYAGRPGTHVVESAGQVIEQIERLTLDTLSV